MVSKPVPILPANTKSCAVVVADEQRAQADACALRIGEPADDELLRRLALHLQPVLRAPMLVRRAAALGDHALPALAPGPLPRLRVVDQLDAPHRRPQGQRAAAAHGAPRAAAPSRPARSARGCRRRDTLPGHPRPPRRRGSLVDRQRRDGRGEGRQVLRQPVARVQPHVAPRLYASSRMPSNLRSNSQSGPVKRSCVSVAAIGSSQSGIRAVMQVFSRANFWTIHPDPGSGGEAVRR